MDIEKSIRENQLGAKLHIGKVLGGVANIEKSVTEDIIKGKPAVAGEIREWSGKKYKKQPNGKWMEVSEHGMTKKEHGDFKVKLNIEANKNKPTKSGDKQLETQLKVHDIFLNKLSDKEYDEEELGGGEKKEKKISAKVKNFLEKVRISDGKIKLSELTVEATPKGNWAVYRKGKELMVVDGSLLDDNDIMEYGLEHHRNLD